MSKMPKVALLVETARGYGRQVLHGIVRYARLHGPWAFYVTPGDFVQSLPEMEEWGGTGIIARIETPQVAKAILATRLPVVAMDLSQLQLAPGSPWLRMCQLTSDSGRGRAGPACRAPVGKRASSFRVRRHRRQNLVGPAAAGLRPTDGQSRIRAPCIPCYPSPASLGPRTGGHVALAGGSAEAGGHPGLQ